MKEKDFENAVIYNGKKYRIKEFVSNDRCKLCAIEKLGKNCGGVCLFFRNDDERISMPIYFEEVKE